MNVPETPPLPPAPGESLADRLLRLQPPASPRWGDDPRFEEKLLRELRRHKPPPDRPRSFRNLLERQWETFLFAILFTLLGWEILGIIRYLFN